MKIAQKVAFNIASESAVNNVLNSTTYSDVLFHVKIGLGQQFSKKYQDLKFDKNRESTQCSKITENVSLDIASEASNVYILSGQKFIENAKKMFHFGEFLNN